MDTDPKRTSSHWKPLLAGAALLLIGILIGVGISGANQPSASASTITAGTWAVGTGPGKVAPGVYRSPGPDGTRGQGRSCYFARLSNNDDDFRSIIENRLSDGPTLLTVQSTDRYVQVSGCWFTKAP